MAGWNFRWLERMLAGRQLDYPRLLFMLAVASWGLRYVLNPMTWTLVDHFNLVIHEAGHVFFWPFGRFLMLLGGSLLQVALPLAISAYFYFTRQPYSAAVTLVWTAQSLINTSVYIADASARQLPLITHDPNTHDWWQLLRMLGWLRYDVLLGNFVYSQGLLLYLLGLWLGFRCAVFGSRSVA